MKKGRSGAGGEGEGAAKISSRIAADSNPALLVTRLEGAGGSVPATLDSLAAAQGGVQLVNDDPSSPTWVFPDAAAAVAAALEMRRAVGAGRTRSASRVWLHAEVHAADAGTLRVGDRIWPIVGMPDRQTSERTGGGRKMELGMIYNQPVPGTSFIGREMEIAASLEALSTGCLVTLTGSGGCGKTRLALEVASASTALYPDGAWWVELAAVTEPSSVPSVVGRALGLWLDTEPDPAEALASYLADRQILIVLDNCEHLVGACRALVARIVPGCAGVRILATSREPLGLEVETATRVPSLDVSGHEDLIGESTAGRLFAERARAVRPNFWITKENAADVLRICRRLDGIPLAIELAAARTRLLTPRQIAAGLEEDFGLLGTAETPLQRQQTLEASVTWSYGLCSDVEQLLLRRLAAFTGGFTLDAVEAVCDSAPLSRYDVLDRMIDRSMVAVDDARPDRRFRLLEIIREFARARLEESGESDGLRDRHLAHFCSLAETAEAALPRTGGLAWIPRLEDDYDNLLSALNWASTRGEADNLLRLAGSMGLFWEMRGRFTDGAHWLDRALELGDGAGGEPGALGVRALWARAHLAIYSADFQTAMSIARVAVDLADKIGDQVAAARLRNTLGFALCYSDPPAALKVLEESIAIGTAASDDWAVADSTKFLTVAHLVAGDVQGCETALGELQQVATRLGNAFFLGWCDGGLGYCQLLRGQLREAIDSFDRSVASAADVGDPATVGIAQAWRAYALAKLGRYAECRDQATECLTRTIRQGGGLGAPFARIALGVADMEEGNIESGVATLGEVADWSRAAGDTMSALWAVPLFGQALVGAGRADEARAALADALHRAAPPIQNPWSTAQAIYGRGLLAEAGDDAVHAEQLFHQALAIQHQHGFLADALASLHAIAMLAAGAESWQEAGRLLGAVDKLSAGIGLVPSQQERTKRAAVEAAARAEVGDAAFHAAGDEGATLSLDDTVAYAARARGARGRPIHGWESLTPTEQRVVARVTEGLTNPEIADRLFMSRATVKTHLAHIFARLGVNSRSELAAAAARRAVAPRSNSRL